MPLKVFIIAGESSGDALGASLMDSLQAEYKEEIAFSGVGGPLMEKQGLEKSLFPMDDIAVMGVLEIVPQLHIILKRMKETVDHIISHKPDIVITIDAPDFNFRVVKAVRKYIEKQNGVGAPKFYHYVAPTVWAWRPERAAKVAELYDGIMCLYPFEPDYFRAEGMKAEFVGHPVTQHKTTKKSVESLRKELEIPADATILGVLFGSRHGELNRTGPVLRDAAMKFVTENKNVHIVSLTLPHLQRQAQNLLEGMWAPTHLITDAGKKWDLFSMMDVAMATSGTVGLELAIANVPHVISYKMTPLTWNIIRSKVKVRYAHLGNILLDGPVIPEFIQSECLAYDIDMTLNHLLKEKKRRTKQTDAFKKVRDMLATGKESPSQRAAKFILKAA